MVRIDTTRIPTHGEIDDTRRIRIINGAGINVESDECEGRDGDQCHTDNEHGECSSIVVSTGEARIRKSGHGNGGLRIKQLHTEDGSETIYDGLLVDRTLSYVVVKMLTMKKGDLRPP